MKEQKEIHIGSLIKEKMEERGLSVSDFAHALHYERTNIYKIFKRSSIDVDLLLRISEVLAYDFLREVYLADEPRRYSITIEAVSYTHLSSSIVSSNNLSIAMITLSGNLLAVSLDLRYSIVPPIPIIISISLLEGMNTSKKIGIDI